MIQVIGTVTMKSIRILPANLLYLISMVLSIAIGATLERWRMWPGQMAAELFGILLPALLFASATGLRKTALRLKWVGMRHCWMGLAIGAGLFPMAAAVAVLTEKILGYTVEFPESFFPAGAAGTLVFVLALAISAPICEEMVFRGYILAAYERAYRPRTAILAVAALFTAYHLSPLRFPVVAPIAVALTFVAWRTGSVWPSIAMHMGANGTAALLNINRHAAMVQHPRPLLFAAIGIAATAAAIVCLWRIAVETHAPEAPQIAPDPVRPTHWGPLFAAAWIVVMVAGAEITHSRRAEQRSDAVRVQAPWNGPADWVYEIYAGGVQIGEADYHIRDLGPGGMFLFGSATLRASNGLSGVPMKLWFNASWDVPSMMLRRFHGEVTRASGFDRFDYAPGASRSPEAWLAGGLYSPYELPWRLSAASLIETRRASPVSLPRSWETSLRPGARWGSRSFASNWTRGSKPAARAQAPFEPSAWSSEPMSTPGTT